MVASDVATAWLPVSLGLSSSTRPLAFPWSTRRNVRHVALVPRLVHATSSSCASADRRAVACSSVVSIKTRVPWHARPARRLASPVANVPRSVSSRLLPLRETSLTSIPRNAVSVVSVRPLVPQGPLSLSISRQGRKNLPMLSRLPSPPRRERP